MTYTIRWMGTASRDMDALPLKTASAVAEFVYGPLAENPHRVGKPLRLQLEGKHSARRGSYRIVYQIVDARVEIHVIAVQHRADAYR